jgi:hypothetical protein
MSYPKEVMVFGKEVLRRIFGNGDAANYSVSDFKVSTLHLIFEVSGRSLLSYQRTGRAIKLIIVIIVGL